jgi:hypothetical protein
MRLSRLLTLVVVSLTIGSCLGFSIEERSSSGYNTYASVTTLPPGNYSESCYDCTMSFGQLKCWCNDRNRSRRFTTMTMDSCNGTVRNNYGVLECVPSLPQGSYLSSCSNCVLSNGTLSCSCRNADGFSRGSSLNVRFCRDSVSNQNGSLTCGEPVAYRIPQAPPPPPPRALPRGSYQGSCSSCTINGDTLSCSCRNADGFSRGSSINTRYCYDSITNQNGSLTCGEPPAPRQVAREPVYVPVPMPRGNYQQSCSGCSMSGDTLSCSCDNADGIPKRSSLNSRFCRDAVENCNGSLNCGRC